MTEPEIRAALSTSVEEALEIMFFTSVLWESEKNAPREGDVSVRLRFQCSIPGVFCLRVCPKGARRIAANFLAQDEEALSGTEVSQTVCELANMICGSALSRLDLDACLHLAAPELVSPEDGWPQGDWVARSFHLDDGVLTAGLQFQQSP